MPRRIETDVEKAKTIPGVVSCVFNKSDETVTLVIHTSADTPVTFIITITDDYPTGASFYFCEESKESGAIDGSLVDQLVPQLLKKVNPNQQQQNPNANDDDDDDVDANRTKSKNKNNNNSALNENSGMNMSQQHSQSSDSGTGGAGGTTEMLHYYSDGGNSDQNHDSDVCAELAKDLHLANAIGYKATYDKVALGVRVHIFFSVADLCSENQAIAWGFDRGEDFDVRLAFERPEYTKSEKPPEVVVFQRGKPCRFGQQVKSFLDLYLKNHWDRGRGFIPPVEPSGPQTKTTTTNNPQNPSDKLIVNALAKDMSVYNPINDVQKYTPFRPDTEGFLVHVLAYVRHRFPTAHTYCVICDNPHRFGGGMLKPCVCDRELCTYAFQQLKVGADAASNVAMGGAVVDLLVALLRLAVESDRRHLIVDPYPQVVDPVTGKLALDPKNKDFDLLQRLMRQLPPAKELVSVDNISQLSDKLNRTNPLLVPFLDWIISSNRSLILKLLPHQQLTELGTPHQFIFVSASPEKQAKFDAAKKIHGSRFCWHGSPSARGNWHCILRNGLKIYSNKPEFMTTDTGYYGTAIYTAVSASTSLAYAQAHSLGAYGGGAGASGNAKDLNDERNRFFDQGGTYACLALCEIVKDPKYVADHVGGSETTIMNEDLIITRFFFVFTTLEHVQKAAANGEMNRPEFAKKVENLVKELAL